MPTPTSIPFVWLKTNLTKSRLPIYEVPRSPRLISFLGKSPLRVFAFTASLLLGFTSCLVAQQPLDLPIEPRPNLLIASSTTTLPFSTSDQEETAQQETAEHQTPEPQTTPQPAPDAQQAQPQDNSRSEADREVKQQETQRMLGIVPAFNEVIGGKAVPLKPSQKFNLFFHSAFDPYQFGIVALDAGIEQWEDQYPEYHYGIQGYARRYAASFADNFDGNFWGNAVLPSILHQDPRYYRMGHGPVMKRLLYSVSTAVICKGDNGHWQPNISNVAGNLIGGGFSNFYYPASDRGIGLTFERGLTVTATGSIGALAEEFYPDAAAYFSRRHARKIAAQQATQQAAASSQPH